MKKYVKVTATFDCDGDLIPEYIVWDDGRRYRIDKISVSVRLHQTFKNVK